jgi:protease I
LLAKQKEIIGIINLMNTGPRENPMKKKLKGFKIAILASDGFEESEMIKPKKALEKEGAIVHLIAPQNTPLRSWHQNKWHKKYPVHASLGRTKPETYNALLLPGGVLNPDKLRMNKKAVKFMNHFFKENKPIAAICHAPLSLIETKRLKNRKMTSYPSIKTDLLNAGAQWENKAVVLDKNLITSRTPKDIPQFVRTLIKVAVRKINTEKKLVRLKIQDIAAKPFIK